MRPTLRRKLTVSFLLISLISFLIIAVFANIILERQFKKYVIDNLDQEKKAVVAMLQDYYDISTGKWNVSSIENLGVRVLGNGLILRVVDGSNNVIWDAMEHNEGFCADMLQSMAENMEKQYGIFRGGYTESSYRIQAGLTGGTVTIGYYGPYFYSDNDLLFLNTLNKLLLLATGVTAFISIFIGMYTSKRLSGPISRVIKKAEQISQGNYNGRIVEAPNTREIVELTDSINTLAESLGRQEILRKRLTADVAHELRTPITNLQGHLEAMIDGVWEADTERLKSCHEETVRLTKIVMDLESLARYENEKLRLQLEDINISQCLSKALKSFENEINRKGILIITDLTDQQAWADKDKIMQVFFNLISNAIKYTPSGGKISLSVSDNSDYVVISIKDTGIGISEEDLPNIFERFYRADKSRTRETGGAGIGLAIAKSIVAAHKGSIEVKSEYGKGSEFIVYLHRNKAFL
ncbi:MAG: ATP-binding protein [Oscillospiraceae bacterium]|nr:ATP-binding protein [Oscillospiraceae bacterium]